MHYQHRYHAGNFADVIKHLVLTATFEALNRKPAAWCFIDTHAGAGEYDLADPETARTGEAEAGIMSLLRSGTDEPLLRHYLDAVARDAEGASLRRYPGSPAFALAAAREDDRLILCERVAAVAADLRAAIGRDRRVAIHTRDGYEMAALLPPAQKRGVVLVDPPYERVDEFRAVADFLKRAVSRFAHGVYLVWYPLKNRHVADRMVRTVSALGREFWDLRFDTGAPAQGQMHACGMLLLNPPYGLDTALQPALDVLKRALAQGSRASWELQRY